MITKLDEIGKTTGLNININKTKLLTGEQTDSILTDNTKLECITETVYLGQLISLDNKTEKRISRRITL